MENEFAAFLAAGLVILAFMLLISSGNFSMTGAAIEASKVSFAGETDLASAVFVGADTAEKTKSFSFGDFDASYARRIDRYEIGDRELQSGILFGNNKAEYSISGRGIDRLIVKFRVVSSNGYGPLTIKINGNAVSEGVYPEGNHTVIIDSGLSDSMTVEIESSSSFWKMWAPNIYRLEDIEISARNFESREAVNFFDLSGEEYDSFISGKIELALAENTGEIFVSMNGQTLYSGPVKNYHSLEIGRTHILRGVNTAVIKSSANSEIIGSAKVVVFYLSKGEKAISAPFNISQQEYIAMEKGRISFRIVSLRESGAVRTRITWGGNALFNAVDNTEAREYEYSFDKSAVAVGANYLTIGSLDGAQFYVKDLDISIS